MHARSKPCTLQCGENLKREEHMIEAIRALFANYALLAAVFAWLSAQILKFFIHAAINRKFSFERLHGDGGMPSGHSATVMALATMVGYLGGFDSIHFAVAMVFAIVVMHDATGVRRETGKQAMDIVQIFGALNDILGEKDKLVQREKLKTFVGHSPVQVFCGAILGILVSVLYILIAGL